MTSSILNLQKIYILEGSEFYNTKRCDGDVNKYETL